MTSRVTERGQVTIPKELRERLGIRPGQVMDFEECDGALILRRRQAMHPVDAAYGILERAECTDDLMVLLRGEPPGNRHDG